MRAVLIDAGPIIALLDRSDRNHHRIVQALKRIRDPLVTAWPVVVESMYLLRFSWEAQRQLWHLLEADLIDLLPLDRSDYPPMRELMERYRDLPMDMADAALVHLAARESIERILTLDRRDFNVYRLPDKSSLLLLP